MRFPISTFKRYVLNTLDACSPLGSAKSYNNHAFAALFQVDLVGATVGVGAKERRSSRERVCYRLPTAKISSTVRGVDVAPTSAKGNAYCEGEAVTRPQSGLTDAVRIVTPGNSSHLRYSSDQTVT